MEENKTNSKNESENYKQYEDERESLYANLFVNGGAIVYGNVTINHVEGDAEEFNSEEYDDIFNLRNGLKYELFCCYFGKLYTKLQTYFSAKGNEIKKEFEESILFENNYKSLIYLKVCTEARNLIENYIYNIPDSVLNKDDFRISLSDDSYAADQKKGLRLVHSEPTHNCFSHTFSISTLEIDWFIDEQTEPLFEIIDIPLQLINSYGALRRKDPKDGEIITTAMRIKKEAKEKFIKCPHKAAILKATEELGFKMPSEEKLSKLNEIMKRAWWKENNKDILNAVNERIRDKMKVKRITKI